MTKSIRMDGSKPSNLDTIYHTLIQVIFGDCSFDKIRSHLSPQLTILGTAEHERIIGVEAFEQLIKKQNIEMSDMTLTYQTQSTIADTPFSNGTVHLFVEEILVRFIEIEHNMLFRLSTIWNKENENWMLLHCHSSAPDQNISDREAWPIEGIMKKNRELEEKIASKTAELRSSLESLKATQDQLIHSEKMASLGELTAGIAHEIQNPLNFVNNFSEVSAELLNEVEEELAKGDVNESKLILNDLKENINKISQHGKRASSIVKGMLDHSRTSSGEKVPTDMNTLCEEYLRLAYHGLRAKDKSFNASFETDLDPELPMIALVPQDFGRVILNLINNAFQAVFSEALMKEDSDYRAVVIVSTRKLENGIEISVSDNGPGIPNEIKDKIFQPFFTTKPTGQGTGLGLSLAYDIVKAHGGKLTVNSELEKGTIFKIQLPMRK